MGFDIIDSGRKDDLIKIRVIGVGGGGGNAVNNMILQGTEGVDFVVVNTDAQDLERSKSKNIFQLGSQLTRGLGAGGVPDVGRESALEDRERLVDLVDGCNMVFIAAGMGGGTGTGAAPIIAQVAKECGALTVAVVTRPFSFEGNKRRKNAEEGIENLRQCVDTLITIPNQRLISIANENTTISEAFERADRVLHQAVKGVSDLINITGLVNVDFADVKTIMQDKGIALMGVGQAAGEDRVMRAAQMAVNSPLLDEVSLSGARSVLVNITSNSSIGIIEVDQASQMIKEEAHEEVELIWGCIIDEEMENEVRVTVIATDFQEGWQNPRAAASTLSQDPRGGNSGRGGTPGRGSGMGGPIGSGGMTGRSGDTSGYGATQSQPKKPSIYDVPGFFKKQ